MDIQDDLPFIIPAITVNGSVIGGNAVAAGDISVAGDIGALTIGGDLRAGVANTGGIGVQGHVGLLTIGGDIVGSVEVSPNAQVDVFRGVDLFRIGGSIRGNVNQSARIDIGSNLGARAVGTLLVSGNMDYATITTDEDGDALLGRIKVSGDWIASRLAIGTTEGPDQIYGTDDDVLDEIGDGGVGKLTIKGQLLGTVADGDSFRIMARHIGKIKVGEVLYPLTAGSDNLALGPTPDVHAFDVG